jgi:hypothetical protein
MEKLGEEDHVDAADRLFAAGEYAAAAAKAADGLQRKGLLPDDIAKLLSRKSEVLRRVHHSVLCHGIHVLRGAEMDSAR